MNSKIDPLLMSLPSSRAGLSFGYRRNVEKWLKASAESLIARTKDVIENLDCEDWTQS
mgnify:CR=1 FL=1